MYDVYYNETLPDDIPIIVEDSPNAIYNWFENNGLYPLIVFLDHEMRVHHMENDGIPDIDSINDKINEMLANLPTMSTSIDDNIYFIDNFNIVQLYPNPFNPVLHINFDIAWSGVIQVDILNISGFHIETIYSGFLQSGSHELRWNAESIPSGMYLVSLKFSDKSLTEKVILLK